MSEDPQVELGGHHKAVKMGLGDALRRLLKVEALYANGVTKVPEQMIEERDLIIAALNDQFELNLGFDCNDDDVPDTVAIFQQTASTSCCRILPTEIQKQVKKRSSRSTPSAAQKKRPEEEVAVPVRHSGLKKTTSPRPILVDPTQDSIEAPVMTEVQTTVARIYRGLKKSTPEPTPA